MIVLVVVVVVFLAVFLVVVAVVVVGSYSISVVVEQYHNKSKVSSGPLLSSFFKKTVHF